MTEKSENIIGLSEAILEDHPPKSVKAGLETVIACLKGEDDISVQKNKCTNVMEELVDNENIDPFVRTQLWDVVALIEQL